MNIIVLAFVYDLGYHVLRALEGDGHHVYVLGQDTARGLARSSACNGYRELIYHPDTHTVAEAASEIAAYAAAVGATAVVPSEILSTRLLIAVREMLPVRTCLLPDAAIFDRVNDKWAFAEICRKSDVRIPQTEIFTDRDTLQRDLDAGRLALPLVLKPIIGMGSKDVNILSSREAVAALPSSYDQRYLIQRFVTGTECGISIVARDRRIVACAVQIKSRQRYTFIRAPQLEAMIQRFVAETGFEGAANFDTIREDGSGDHYVIECNPRFWYSIFALNVAGLNMVRQCLESDLQIGAEPITIPFCVIPVRRAIVEDFVRLKWSRGLFAMIAYIFHDLRGALAEQFRSYNDDISGKGGMADQLRRLDLLTRTTAIAEQAAEMRR
jgi:biotin carboxylase